jgi:glycosyltransferase involved in cell wall biosynthesis
MAEKKQILIIGTYTSRSNGSISKAEELQILLGEKYDIKLCSTLSNKFFRLLDIIISVISFKGKLIIVDTYSGQAFIIAEVVTRIGNILGKKVVLILHGGMLPEFHQKFPLRIAKTFSKAQELLSPSIFLQEYFSKFDFKIRYFPNWVNLEIFSFDHQSNRYPNSLLWVRAFTEIYDPLLAIFTLDLLRKTYPDIRLTMVGPDKGLLEEVRRKVEELELKNHVIFTGPIPNYELPNYYQSHSIYLNTTRYESFGVALIEAAACGTPIVSTAVGEIPYMWKDHENMLFAQSPETFVDCIKVLLLNNEKARLQAENAMKKAMEYSWTAIKPLWLDLFEKSI